MKAWQRQIREQKAIEPPPLVLFQSRPEVVAIEDAELRPVDYATASSIITEYEWLGNMSSNFVRAYGIFWDGECGGVVVYGSTVNNKNFAKSTCGIEYADRIIQLQRGACVHWAHKHAASRLIAYSLREEEKRGTRIVVAFSDPAAGEIGTVYQATNWLYCGLTVKRPDYETSSGTRMTGPFGAVTEALVRTERRRKHRYCYLLGNPWERKKLRGLLKWPVLDYPKREAA